MNGFLVPENFSEIELADAMFRAYRLFDTDTLPDNLLPMHCRQADRVQSLLRIARADEPFDDYYEYLLTRSMLGSLYRRFMCIELRQFIQYPAVDVGCGIEISQF